MMPLPPRQQQVRDFIKWAVAKKRMPPTRREIAAYIGVTSVNCVNDHVNAIARKGYIDIDHNKSRAITIVGAGRHVIRGRFASVLRGRGDRAELRWLGNATIGKSGVLRLEAKP